MNIKFLTKIILSIAIIISVNTFGQNETEVEKAPVKIGVKFGYSIGNLKDNSSNTYTKDFESTDGADIGVTFEFPINDGFSVQTEINYIQRGGLRNGMQPAPNDELYSQLNQFLPLFGFPEVTDTNPLFANFEGEIDLNYLEFPVLAKFIWGNKTKFYVEGGLYTSILVSAKQYTSGTSQLFLDENGSVPVFVPNPNYNPADPTQPPVFDLPPQSFEAETDIKDDLKTVNFGVVGGVGIIQQISDRDELYLGARGSYSFNSIQINNTFGESKIGGIIFSIGYAYTL